MALATAAVWEIRPGGSDTLNSGGFVTGASGTDYSQQTSAQYTLTNASSAGASATIAHASASADMVGNICQITAGTNFTNGFYEILSVVVGVSITVDRNATSGVGSGGTVRIGGCLATLGKLNNVAVAGNIVWMKGSFTLAAGDSFNSSGTTTNPIFVKGYGTSRGDGYQGRTGSNMGLITTNFATLTYNSTFRLSAGGSMCIFECLHIVTAVSNAAMSTGASIIVRSCKLVNSSTNAAAVGLSLATAGICIDCDTSLTGASGGTAALQMGGSGSKAIGCHVVGGPAVGVQVSIANAVAEENLIVGCASHGIAVTVTSASLNARGNTITGCGGDGINVVTSNTVIQSFTSNLISDNTGYGINMVSTGNAALLANNRYRDNTAGNVGNAGQWASGTDYSPITSGNGTSDFMDSAGGDYSLKSTSPAVGTSQPYARSMGAFQRPAIGGGIFGVGMNGGFDA